MRKPTFCLYKCEHAIADQMRGTCNCAADRRLCLRDRDNTSVSDPKTVFSQRGSYSIIMISNHFKRAYQLTSSVWDWKAWLGCNSSIEMQSCRMFLFQII